MALPVILLFIYGILLILGGLMGYIKAKSVPSAVVGVFCGLIILFLADNYTWTYAPHVALFISLLLALLMGYRYVSTRKPMPAIPIVVLSVIVALVQIFVLLAVGAGSGHL